MREPTTVASRGGAARRRSGGRIALAAVLLVAALVVTERHSAPAGASSGVPAFDHIFVVVDENRSYSQIVGAASAPYLNGLVAENALAAAYTAVRHPSLPNYLAMIGGDTFGVTTDCTPATCPISAPTIVDEVEASGRTWKGYFESMPAPCTTADSGSYAVRHNPFVYFDGIRTDSTRCATHVVPATALENDLSSPGTTPALAWLTANACNDMHNCPVATGDAWLHASLSTIFASPAWTSQRSLVVVTFDEDDGTEGNHVATLVVSPAARAGYRSTTPYTHYSLLRTLEESWDLSPLTSNDAGASPMSDVFTPGGDLRPSADVALGCNDLSCSFDASRSVDRDGSIVSFEWDFGDGTTASGATAAHTYAAAGTYQVTLRLTDDLGVVALATRSVTAGRVAFASDGFGRSVTGGWGAADQGGPWSSGAGLASSFAVGSGVGTMTLTPGSGRMAWLDAYATDDVDATASVAVNRPAAGFGQTASVVGRRVSANNDYRARLRIAPDGVRLAAVKLAGSSTEVVIGTETLLPGVSSGAGPRFHVRIQVSGRNPTTIRAKAWAEPAPEPPAWTVNVTDGTPSLQVPGVVALHAFLSGAAPEAAVFSFDGLASTRPATLPAAGPPPYAADSFARTAGPGWGSADVGGTWSSKVTSPFSVSGGAGRIALSSGSGLATWLAGVSTADADVSVVAAHDHAPTGWGTTASVIVRWINPLAMYRTRLRVAPTGVYLAVVKLAGSTTETVLGREVLLAGAPTTVGTRYHIRMQVTGTSPTTVRAKAWVDPAPEPAQWAVTATDDQPELQSPGAVGVHAFLNAAATAPVNWVFDDLSAIPPA